MVRSDMNSDQKTKSSQGCLRHFLELLPAFFILGLLLYAITPNFCSNHPRGCIRENTEEINKGYN